MSYGGRNRVRNPQWLGNVHGGEGRKNGGTLRVRGGGAERLKREGHLSAIEWAVRAFQKALRKGLWLRLLGAVPEETQRGRA